MRSHHLLTHDLCCSAGCAMSHEKWLCHAEPREASDSPPGMSLCLKGYALNGRAPMFRKRRRTAIVVEELDEVEAAATSIAPPAAINDGEDDGDDDDDGDLLLQAALGASSSDDEASFAAASTQHGGVRADQGGEVRHEGIFCDGCAVSTPCHPMHARASAMYGTCDPKCAATG